MPFLIFQIEMGCVGSKKESMFFLENVILFIFK